MISHSCEGSPPAFKRAETLRSAQSSQPRYARVIIHADDGSRRARFGIWFRRCKPPVGSQGNTFGIMLAFAQKAARRPRW